MTENTPPDDLFAVFLEALEDPDYSMKELAVRGLAVLGDRRAIPPILDSLGDSEESEGYRLFCRRAVAAIGRIGDATAVVPLFRTLCRAAERCSIFEDYRYEEEYLDDALMEVAGMGPGVIEPLGEVITGDYPLDIRVTAIRTLGYVHGPDPVLFLLEVLRDRSCGNDIAPYVACGLGARRAEEAVDDLCRIILDTVNYGERTRLFAVSALEEIGDPRALRSLLKVFAEQERFGEASTFAYEAFRSIISEMESRPED